ncbi:MAG: PAS domain-containing protein, partial [Chloroflexota bacterium]
MAGLLEAGLELGPMAVLITVPGDRTIERANAAARTLYRGDPTGRPLGDVLPEIAREIDAEGPASSLALVTRTEHMDLQLADGTWSPVEVWVQMVAGGRLLVIARDLTEMVENQRRALRLARDERARAAELRAVIETMDDAVMLFDWSGAVTLANDAARYLVGGTFATYEQLVAAVGPAEGEMPSLTLSPEHATIHGGRSDRWHEVSVRRIFDEGEVESESSYLVVVHDATAAQELAAAHEAFVGVLAHELRTPVTTIFGNARLLRAAGAVAPEEQTEVLADIEVEADRLHRLIEDLLVLSRAEREILAVDGEPVDLSRVLRATAEAE